MRRNVTVAIAAAALAAIATHASAHAEPEQPRTECIVFEDDSFMCGYADPVGGWLDRSRPMIVGCIPDGLCDSPDAWRYEGDLDGQAYSEVVFPEGDPRYPDHDRVIWQ